MAGLIWNVVLIQFLSFLPGLCFGCDLPLKNGTVFDFIVVGAGTAGCVVAARLAESGKHSVLLISEGGLPSPYFEVPVNQNGGFPAIKKYFTLPQRFAGLANDGLVQYWIGRELGGGSGVNGMGWIRGNPLDYENWVKATNDDSWSYPKLLKYFRKSENYSGFNPTDQRGYSGPITITSPNFTPGMAEFFQAGEELGYPFGDANGPQTASMTMFDFSINKMGRRVSSFYGYIRPQLIIEDNKSDFYHSRNNKLTVLLNSWGKRVIFQGNRAVGVELIKNGNCNGGYFVRANIEVVISCGVMDSPALLLRSGVGAEGELRRLKIPVVKDLPGVGTNLHDHSLFRMPIILGNRSAALVPSRDLTPENWQRYLSTGQGPYSSVIGISSQGFLLSSFQDRKRNASGWLNGWSDIQFIPLHLEQLPNATSPPITDLKENEVIVLWGVSVSRPKSRGSVRLNPDDPMNAKPLIDLNFLSNPDDMKVMLDSVKYIEVFCEQTKAMRGIGCRLPSGPVEQCRHLTYRSDAYWSCYIWQLVGAALHGGGSNRMGFGRADLDAVVDSQLRVIGIDGLRVADASVMPQIINGNTQAAVYVIAEKVADMILQKWGR